MTVTAPGSTITLTGASRITYQFTLYPLGTQFKPLGAVYAMLAQRPDGMYVRYVGQTGDLATRHDDHHKAACFRTQGVTHTGVLLEGSEQRRFAIETDLVRAYDPPCNG